MAEFYYGGQAVIEGVMMRGQHRAAIAVRDPEGNIVIHEEDLNPRVYQGDLLRRPFLRGLVLLWDALVLGTRALMWSADVALDEGDDSGGFDGPIAWGTIAVSLLFGIALFFLLPTAVSQWLESVFTLPKSVSGLLEGLLRIVLFVAYLLAISRMEDVRRVFSYHGAEHKTINAYEAGAPLTPEHVARYSTVHTRCGTSFLLFVLVISVLLFVPLQFDSWYWRMASRIPLIPVVASLAYELLRFSTRQQHHTLMRLMIAPGLALQRLTTREPSPDMLEVAIAALKPVLAADGLSWPAPTMTAMPLAEVTSSTS